ncbi:MAG: hypothetical protein FJ276_03290 [Planctomycetes bacterium]|nr:hypothetical protein [Planctomycetota bacterium]
MKHLALLLAVSLISLLHPGAVASSEPVALPAGTKVMCDVSYVEHGHERQKLGEPLGLEIHLKYPGTQPRYRTAVEFLKAKLLAGAAAKPDGQ